ncbi:Prolyl 3,4-dihydroxylase OGFOD1 [Porphyridium purpureum]|uniref:Prolyl 3,4-dihydroxylase OGFOD1 n=1 Tax=Porphyridium purpureum TaxID=35688 RepID=A0A5J4YMY8_PORPP|nr:Prolyl 3,4-dihydroxylase OGFOD1 [Porphyridium purpureum]|eukprot:POR6883..scf249_10
MGKRSGSGPSKGIRKRKRGHEAAPAREPLGKVPGNVLRNAWFEEESAVRLEQELKNATPYPHAVLDPLCNPQHARAIFEEIKTSMKSDFKETDLFKVFQTNDLANFTRDSHPELENLLALRDELYSERFRAMIERITGCTQKLNEKTDCAVNAYVQGCHLLCHDDVIGTRAISYIIYLHDPDDTWTSEDGGNLELYDSSPDPETGGRIPHSVPSTSVLPKYNTLALFPVQPGQSFHSVQEVFAPTKPRISIQGWYHADAPPKDAEQYSTVAQLLAERSGREGDAKFTCVALPCRPTDDLKRDKQESTVWDASWLAIESVRETLIKWINPVYLDKQSVNNLREKFEDEYMMELHSVLLPDIAHRLEALLVQCDERDKLGNFQVPSYKAGMPGEKPGSCWQLIGPPHMQRYLRLETTTGVELDEAASLLEQIRSELVMSPAFAVFLAVITGMEPLEAQSAVRRFRPGLDYTVAHVGGITTEVRLDATFCFADCRDKLSVAKWDDGDMGGFDCYIEQDEDSAAEASAVYRADEDDEGPLASFQASFNTLTLVARDPGVMRFIKYVSAGAPGSRWDISAEFKVNEGDAESEGEGEESESESGSGSEPEASDGK